MARTKKEQEPEIKNNMPDGYKPVNTELDFATFDELGDHVTGVFCGWFRGKFGKSPKIKQPDQTVKVLPQLSTIETFFETLNFDQRVHVEFIGFKTSAQGRRYKDFIFALPESDIKVPKKDDDDVPF